jgi:hypothetical protein
MTTAQQALFDAVLADLAYLDTLVAGMEEVDFRRETAQRITLPLAEEVASRFEVLAVRSDPASNYQGVVFRDRTTGELYLANRGTDPTFGDIVEADDDFAAVSGRRGLPRLSFFATRWS